ncbi:hypothetical protein [Terricaulis sp.]|uniref:hypothetical protein n=1 Tax=Terricaulis sp. TaxID=2768686 RepID=UPI003782FA16
MSVLKTQATDVARRATREDIRHMLGDIEDVVAAEILSVQPSCGELSDAAIWVRGDGDFVAREHKDLNRNAMAIAEIITRLDDDEAAPD